MVKAAKEILLAFIYRCILLTLNPIGQKVKGIPREFVIVYWPRSTNGLTNCISKAEETILNIIGRPWTFSHPKKVAIASFPNLINAISKSVGASRPVYCNEFPGDALNLPAYRVKS